MTKKLLAITIIILINIGLVSAVECGDMLDHDTTLEEDLICDGVFRALELGFNGVDLDCNGYTISGSGTSDFGIILHGISGSIIKNCNIEGFFGGIYIQSGSDYNNISENNIKNNEAGIFLEDSNNNNIYNNIIKDHNYDGILIVGDKKNTKTGTSGNVFWNNQFINNPKHVEEESPASNYWNNSNIGNYWDDFETNEGYPCYYKLPYSYVNSIDYWPIGKTVLEGGETITQDTIMCDNLTNIQGDGLIIGSDNIKLDCNNHLIKGKGNGLGINTNGKNNIKITNCTITGFHRGVYVNDSAIILINNSEIYSNKWGITLDGSSSNVNIFNNNIYDNKKLGDKPKPPIVKKGGGDGKNHPFQTTALAVMPFVPYIGVGVKLENKTYNVSIIHNDFTSNHYGIKIMDGSTDNIIHHNNFQNSKNAYDANINQWDDGVSEGNYWSDYSGTGTYAIPGGDSVDRYPQDEPN